MADGALLQAILSEKGFAVAIAAVLVIAVIGLLRAQLKAQRDTCDSLMGAMMEERKEMREQQREMRAEMRLMTAELTNQTTLLARMMERRVSGLAETLGGRGGVGHPSEEEETR